jgi:hypothetical protein
LLQSLLEFLKLFEWEEIMDPINERNNDRRFNDREGTTQVSIFVPGDPNDDDWRDLWHVTLAGSVLVDLKGTRQDWEKQTVEINIKFNRSALQNWKTSYAFKIKEAAPFFTLNRIRNDHHAVNAGWEVGLFRLHEKLEIQIHKNLITDDFIPLQVDIGVRDVDGYLVGIGYHLTMTGYAVPQPEIPAKPT